MERGPSPRRLFRRTPGNCERARNFVKTLATSLPTLYREPVIQPKKGLISNPVQTGLSKWDSNTRCNYYKEIGNGCTLRIGFLYWRARVVKEILEVLDGDLANRPVLA